MTTLARRPMRAFAAATLLGATLTWAAPRAAQAQRLERPVVLFEPGLRTVDALSSESGAGSATGLNLRLVTVIPTTWHRVDLFVGTQFSPFGLSGGGSQENDPAFFYGARIPLLGTRHTDGWLELALPIMGYYRYDPTGRETRRLYKTDVVLEGALALHVGRKLLADLGGTWAQTTAYVLVDQALNATIDPLTDRVDRFRPTFFYGLSIPLAGRRPER